MKVICYASSSNCQCLKKNPLLSCNCNGSHFLLCFPIDPPTAPGTPSVSITIPGQQFIITWNEPLLKEGERVDTYFVNISGPDSQCGNVNTLQRVTTRSYTCSGWTMPAGQTYTFTVAATNCDGSLRGPESDPYSVSLEGLFVELEISYVYQCTSVVYQGQNMQFLFWLFHIYMY